MATGARAGDSADIGADLGADVGIIGGTGLYSMPGLSAAREVEVETPFGAPSSPVLLGRLHGRRVAFLSRHGKGHGLLPTEIPYRANVYALRALGVRTILSASAVGSLREDVPPRSVLVPDQFVDWTRRRPLTFFGEGVVAHVAFGDPVCRRTADAIVRAAGGTAAGVRSRATYLCMEGPQFSTRAESLLYRSWGCDVIGMTNVSEARLAREAEICYATLALVTDYDAWRPHESSVEAEEILEVLKELSARAAAILSAAVEVLADGDCPCRHALKTALVTSPSRIPAAARERLAAILAPYLPPA